MIDANEQPREAWLNSISEDSRKQMTFWFDTFLKFTGKTAKELLHIRRNEISTGDLNNYVEQGLTAFYEALTTGKIKTKQGKPYSENSAKAFCASVKSFFSFYGMPLRKKTFKKGKKAIVESKKRHLFLKEELAQVLQRASLRDKAVIILGTMGLDASSVSERKIQDFKGMTVEEFFVASYIRPKTRQKGLIIPIREARQILAEYIKTLPRNEGWLFTGYQKRHLSAEAVNDLFVKLCNGLIEVGEGEQVNFHCLRKYFSSQMQGVLPQILIDFCQAHSLSANQKAYVEFTFDKVKEIYEKSHAEEYLRIQPITDNGSKIELQKQKETMETLMESMKAMKSDYEEKIADLESKLSRFVTKFKVVPTDRGEKTET